MGIDRAPAPADDELLGGGLEDESAGFALLQSSPAGWLRTHLARPRPGGRWSSGTALVVGLLLGWLVIGWWLWPVQWAGCAPWHLQPEHQKRFVALVASEYARTGDASRASADLAGWEAADLTGLLLAMEREALNPEARAEVAALRQALPGAPARRSLWTAMVGQGAVRWSVTLATLPLVAAAALIAAPRFAGLRRRREEGVPAGAAPGEASLPSWLQAFQEAEPAADEPSEPAPAEAALRTVVQVAAEPEGAPTAQALIAPGEAITELEVDLVSPEEPRLILPDLFDGVAARDPRLEALAPLTQEVDSADLARRSQEIVEELRALSAASAHEAA